MAFKERRPAYLWYVNDWKGSRAVQAMTWGQRGMYRELLDYQWETGAVPDTPQRCARVLGGTTREWTRAWPILRPNFIEAAEVAGGLLNAKLEQLRASRRSTEDNARTAGGKRAQTAVRGDNGRYIATVKKTEEKVVVAPAPVQPPASVTPALSQPQTSLSSSSSFSSSLSLSEERDGPSAAPTNGRKKRPVFEGERFVVFDWQVRDLERMLGAHADAFDLTGFFFDLDARHRTSGQVIPPRDGGTWLQGQVLGEARRRGLPIAVTPADAGKLTTRLANAVARIKAEANRDAQ